MPPPLCARRTPPRGFTPRLFVICRGFSLSDDHNPDALDRRIAEAKAHAERPMAAEPQAEGRGWAIGIEFVGTILVSALLGYLLDRFVFGTAPWLMIVFLLLGFAAGTRRALQTSKQFDGDPRT